MNPPRDIEYRRAERRLIVDWGAARGVRAYDARGLRLACRCAACVDEMTGAPLLEPTRVAADVAIATLELVGNYAIRFTFSDGHGTGIYAWARLVELGVPASTPG